jgi:hypothetical protein
MFGFLRGPADDMQYRQVYAGCCSYQHRTLGVTSLAFLSYEATFLYLLAVDSGAAPRPEAQQETCCRLRRGGGSIYQVDPEYARYCSAFALLLASVKLNDDIADDRSLLARLVRWQLAPSIDAALDHLDALAPDLRPSVAACIEQHAAAERLSTPLPLAEYVVPTARAFGCMFDRFERLLPRDAVRQAGVFQRLGEAIGSAIISFDCAVDWQSDRRRGRYNPLLDRRDVEQAMTSCQRYLTQAGWLCRENFGEQASSSRLLRHVFDRVSARMASLEQMPARRSIWRKRSAGPQLRYGFCDCDCPIGDCPICDSLCDVDGTSCGNWCCCCDCCVAPCDRGQSKADRSAGNLVGKIGVAAGALDPEGVVLIKNVRYPARSVEGTIDDLTSIEVVGQDSFGITVKKAQLYKGRGL